MGESILTSAILICAGVFSFVGAYKNWAWFFESRKARPFVKLLGRKNTRIFYMVLGITIAVIGCGILVSSGV